MHDSKCLELATHFLQDESCDSEETRAELAEAIQAAVEDWFQSREADYESGNFHQHSGKFADNRP